jgi:hypothetical protein
MQVAMALVMAALLLIPKWGVAGAAETYEQLKALEGNWEAELPGFGKLTSTVRVVSMGKAIEEVIGTPAESELSVYTLADGAISLMHYCAMTPDGHQVLLRTHGLDESAVQLDFRFKEAINLHDRGAAHMRRMTLTIIDRDHYSERWIKNENGKDTVIHLQFARH